MHPGGVRITIDSVEEVNLIERAANELDRVVSMSNFNAMPRPATVLVTGERASIVRRREMESDVFRRDVVPEHLARVEAYDRGAACLLSTTAEVAQRPRHL